LDEKSSIEVSKQDLVKVAGNVEMGKYGCEDEAQKIGITNTIRNPSLERAMPCLRFVPFLRNGKLAFPI